MVVKIKTILLTFDIEEFDLPLEFDKKISEEEQFEISRKGTEKIFDLLEKNNIEATFFVSAKFAKQYPELIKKISQVHEVGLHCYEHRDDYSKMNEEEALERLKNGKDLIEKIINKKIIGFRAPRYQYPDYKIIKELGFRYDSSLLPAYIPLSSTYTLGKFNNLFKDRRSFKEKGLWILPITVTPLIRIPFTWITFRNLNSFYYKISTYLNLLNNDFINLVLHPWEFVDLEKMDLPKLIKRNTGDKLINKLQDYINNYKRYDFTTISSYLFTS